MLNKQVNNIARPPIVAVLGHVDHGKTTLLDTIRKSDTAAKEHGGITQHIGAYQIEVQSSKFKVQSNQNKITFIDTPGHEAFSKMRARGGAAADIAILVVAANDGVMPQTEESIAHIKAAGIPMVVAINKMDLPEADEKRVKQQLAQKDVLVEGFGGDVVTIPVSGKTGKGVDKLLEVILLIAEMQGITSDPEAEINGVVIESKQDKQKGILATVIVKNGTLKIGDTIYAEKTRAKVRNLLSDIDENLKVAGPGTPVEIMGWDNLPQVGSEVTVHAQTETRPGEKTAARLFTLPPLDESKKLKIILKSDVAGSLEAIIGSLPKNVEIVHKAIGPVIDSDIWLAKSTGALVIGFNVSASGQVKKLAELEKVRVKTYALIYELLDEVKDVVELINKPIQEEEIGKAEIIAEFEVSAQRVAGCRVVEGFITKGSQIKILRRDKEIGRTRIKSIRHLKEDLSKAEKGIESGVMFDKKLDFKIGDFIIAYKVYDPLAQAVK